MLPEFDSVAELVEFFDTHDMGDHADAGLMKKLTEIARSQQISAETLDPILAGGEGPERGLTHRNLRSGRG